LYFFLKTAFLFSIKYVSFVFKMRYIHACVCKLKIFMLKTKSISLYHRNKEVYRVPVFHKGVQDINFFCLKCVINNETLIGQHKTFLKFVSSDFKQRLCLFIRFTINEYGEKAIEERLQALVAGRDDLVEDHDEQVRVRARKHRDVHRDGGRVRLVQPHAEVALSGQ
jgi:hypothetical protein